MSRLVAVQSQYPASVSPALAARCPGCAAGWVDHMVESRAVLKGWLMRQTVHAALAADYSLALSAVGPGLERNHRAVGLRMRGLPEAVYTSLQGRTLEALRHGPMTRERLRELVPEWHEHENLGWGFDVRGLAVRGEVLMTRQAAAKTEFVASTTWLGGAVPVVREPWPTLLRRYLAAHAPAGLHDFAAWAGIYVPVAKSAFAGVPEAVPVQVAGERTARYILPEQAAALADPPPPPPTRLLPKFDALIMGHKERGLFLPPERRSMVVRPAGQIEAVVLADGVVAGTWRVERTGKRTSVSVRLALPPGARLKKEIETEAERMAESLAGHAVAGGLAVEIA